MSELKADLKYFPSHEWAQVDNDVDDSKLVTVGITDYAQDSLGDIVYIENPAVGSVVTAGEAAAVVESVKAASDIYAPVSGEVVAVNTLLEDAPETTNQSPYEDGWLFKVRPSDLEELTGALSMEQYAAQITEAE